MSTESLRIAAHEAGYRARENDRHYLANPYGHQSPSCRKAWSNGWNEADQLAANVAEAQKAGLMNDVRDAAMELPDGPIRRFGEAVVAWMEERP